MTIFTDNLQKSLAEPENKIQIRIVRDLFRSEFQQHFLEAGFEHQQAGNLIPETDTSVLFTGSTISTFKPIFMEQRIPESGMFMLQDCLRTQNAQKIQEADFQPCWSSYFSSTGTLSRYDDLDKVSHLFWTFLTGRLGLEKDAIRIHIASKDHDLMRYWSISGLDGQLIKDTKDPVYYTHKFGIDGVTGRNCNVAIKGHGSDEYRDIGNIIVIEDAEKKLAVELAYGVETAVSRMLGVSTPIHAAPISEFMPLNNTDDVKIADAVCSSALILRAGIKPVATNRGRVLRRYLQGIAELQPQTGVAVEQLEAAANNVEVAIYGSSTGTGSFIAGYIRNYQAAKTIPERGNLNRTITKNTLKL